MQPTDPNLTSNITGYQQFLFVRLPQKGTSEGLARELDHLGKGMENLHDLAGHPSEDALRRGCFQFLRAEPTLSAERDIPHPAFCLDGSTWPHPTGSHVYRTAPAVRGRATGTGRASRRRSGVSGWCAKTSQLHQLCHDPVRLCSCPPARAGDEIPPGSGDAPEQGQHLVGYGLAAPRELLPAPL
jgi:hypothetical protein